MNKTLASITACTLAVAALTANTALAEATQPTPSAEHKRLQFYVGEWKVEGKLADGKTFQADESCSWFDGGFAVVCRGSSASGSKSLAVLTYAANEKAYGYNSIDNTGLVHAERGTLQGDVWTFASRPGSSQDGKSQFVVKPKGANAFDLTISVAGKDGQWMVVEETTYTRK
jgi:hypothetical protein